MSCVQLVLSLNHVHSETSPNRHSMVVKNVEVEGCRIMEGLLPNFNIMTVPHEMVGLERMLDYRGFTVLLQ